MLIRERAIAYAVAEASVEEIDTLNILQATLLAMRRAVERLQVVAEYALVDGNQMPRAADSRAHAIVAGDATERCISAASILAKTARDALMRALDLQHPGYGFAQHMGYATPEHLDCLQRLGPCPRASADVCARCAIFWRRRTTKHAHRARPITHWYRRLRRLAESPRACREAGRIDRRGPAPRRSALQPRSRSRAVVAVGGGPCGRRAPGPTRGSAEPGRRVDRTGAPLYDAISPVEHGAGILAEIAIARPELPSAQAADAVYLDGVQDPGNAGTLLRSAAAAGVTHVAAAPGTSFLWAPKVLRAAMGAHFALSIYEDVRRTSWPSPSPANGSRPMRTQASRLFPAAWGDATHAVAVRIGGAGLSEATAAVAQRRLRIPVAGGAESLNVAAAAAVCLFEQVRRRAALAAEVRDVGADGPAGLVLANLDNCLFVELVHVVGVERLVVSRRTSDCPAPTSGRIRVCRSRWPPLPALVVDDLATEHSALVAAAAAADHDQRQSDGCEPGETHVLAPSQSRAMPGADPYARLAEAGTTLPAAQSASHSVRATVEPDLLHDRRRDLLDRLGRRRQPADPLASHHPLGRVDLVACSSRARHSGCSGGARCAPRKAVQGAIERPKILPLYGGSADGNWLRSKSSGISG